ncbi:MAG TPA: substrate-binding domain-containing protein [Myxococcaceae bacterium]|nr:substrate-binding domain-containing protein [Myxococcaceae bacterium]
MVALAALALIACATESPPQPTQAAQREVLFQPTPDRLEIAGSGAMTPLASELATAWRGKADELRAQVEPSIGSGAGVRAAAEGAVYLGMVSRPLNDAERQLGLRVIPIALDVVVLATHSKNPLEGLARSELKAIFSGDQRQLEDGTPITPLLRDPQESANEAIERVFPELSSLRLEAYRTGRFRVLYHDDAMGAALSLTPGALGVFSLGAIQSWKLPLKPVAVDQVVPSLAAAEEGRWKATRVLAFVARPERLERAKRFVDFARSSDGGQLIARSGYLPLTEAKR